MKPSQRQRDAVAELLEEGMAQVARGETFAKAAQDPLDSDFEGLDDARQASDAAHDEDDQDAAGQGQDGDDADLDDGEDGNEGEQDDDEDEDGEGAPAFAKAESGGFVDAMPLLQELDRKLERLEALGLLFEEVQTIKGQVTTLAKAVQATAQGTLTLAKAVAPHVDAPLPPRSQQARVTVPTTTTVQPTGTTDAGTVFAKAEQAAADGRISAGDMALMNGVINSRGVAGAREALPQLFSIIEEEK